MKHGEQVSAFEAAFASYVGARHAVAMTNGTVTIQVALMALGIKEGEQVATSPLTMAATSIAILNAGGVPRFLDVDEKTWLMKGYAGPVAAAVPVSLYGLSPSEWASNAPVVDDAAQTLRRHSASSAFTSYSLQRSKILQTGEGGVLVTNDEHLATEAREIASLGYKLGPSQSRIDSDAIKSPTYDRHYRTRSLNARMNDLTAAAGLDALRMRETTQGAKWCGADDAKAVRRMAASFYGGAIEGCNWLTPQFVPEGWSHDYWTFAVACDTPERALRLSDAIVKHGGEKPYPAWRLTYAEPAFRYLRGGDEWTTVRAFGRPDERVATAHKVSCPVAESLQPRLLQFQTNSLSSAERNASALRKAIEELT